MELPTVQEHIFGHVSTQENLKTLIRIIQEKTRQRILKLCLKCSKYPNDYKKQLQAKSFRFFTLDRGVKVASFAFQPSKI